MSGLWYYAEGEETRGPITLVELISNLSHISDATKVPVWRTGFEDWKVAEDVHEIAEQLFRPPPLTPKAPPQKPKAPPPDPTPEIVVNGGAVPVAVSKSFGVRANIAGLFAGFAAWVLASLAMIALYVSIFGDTGPRWVSNFILGAGFGVFIASGEATKRYVKRRLQLRRSRQ